MVGLSVFAAAGDMAGKHWGIAGLSVLIRVVLDFYKDIWHSISLISEQLYSSWFSHFIYVTSSFPYQITNLERGGE